MSSLVSSALHELHVVHFLPAVVSVATISCAVTPPTWLLLSTSPTVYVSFVLFLADAVHLEH